MDINDLKDELENIKDVEIQNLTYDVLKQAPLHFWYRPASSTGKYHAKEENEEGGLVLHTKRVCKVAEVLIDAWIPSLDADVIRSACILHDICKYGTSYSATRYTLNNHPRLGADFLKKIAEDKYSINKVNAISNAILSHSGKWGSPTPASAKDLAVHLADVIATRIYT